MSWALKGKSMKTLKYLWNYWIIEQLTVYEASRSAQQSGCIQCITVDDILSSSWLGNSGGNQLPNGRLFMKAGCVDCVPDAQENLMDSQVHRRLLKKFEGRATGSWCQL